jgi:hypothetical protein
LKAIFVVVVVSTLFFVLKLGQFLVTPPGCNSARTISGLIVALKDSDLGPFAVNDVKTQSIGLLSRERECTGEVASLRGSLNAQDMHWYSLRYTVKTGDNTQRADVAAKLGDTVPLAPNQSGWSKFVEFALY